MMAFIDILPAKAQQKASQGEVERDEADQKLVQEPGIFETRCDKTDCE